MFISGAKINYLFLTFYSILDTTSYLEISSFGISKEFTIYIGMNSFEMPKDDISRYNVVSRMLSKKKLIF